MNTNQRVRYSDISLGLLDRYQGVVVTADQHFAMVRWDGKAQPVKEWLPNLTAI